MNVQMAYLLGMILGNGEIQRHSNETTITIEIPHKNLIDDQGLETSIYVHSSLVDIRNTIEPLIGHVMPITSMDTFTRISFCKNNQDYTMREILRLIGSGVHHSNMVMHPELFQMTTDQKKELLRGIADVTGYIRKSNIAFGKAGAHRVYIEVPGNWQMVIDIANMLKSLDIPVQTIDFGHPNFRDSNLKMYNDGKPNYWKKEHQLKIWANEFLPIGFNILHKRRALEAYADEQIAYGKDKNSHKFYWEKTTRRKIKPIHPRECDESLPVAIRGKHFNSWTELASELGYHD